jgi:hypothetical protein
VGDGTRSVPATLNGQIILCRKPYFVSMNLVTAPSLSQEHPFLFASK